MYNYTFIKENDEIRDTNKPECFLAITEDTIESLAYSETYGDFGKQVGSDEAGNHIELLSEKSKAILKEVEEEVEDTSVLNDNVLTAFDNSSDLYSTFLDRLENECSESDYSEFKTEIKGFTIWDGHNHKTIIVDNGDFDFTTMFEELNEENLVTELNEAIENRNIVKEAFGRKIYETEKYWIEDNYCEGHFESFALYLKSEVELSEI